MTVAIFLKILLTLAATVHYAVQAVYFTHMLQLNSYRPGRYVRWAFQNDGQSMGLLRLWPVLLLAGIFVAPRYYNWLYAACIVLFLVSAWLNHPKKAKKPLVCTKRVWRLFATEAVLWAAAMVGFWLFGNYHELAYLALVALLVWVWVLVADTVNLPMENAFQRRFMNDAKRRFQSMPNLTVIGITGSYGKTSTKNFLYALLSEQYDVLMTPENFNTPMGLTRTVREHLRPHHEIFIAEMGAKCKGDIRELCELVHPRYGVITAIGEQHLETFKTVDTIVSTKFELADALPADGCVFLNADDERIRQRPVSGHAVRYAVQPDGDADYTVSDIAVDEHGSAFTVHAPSGESRRFETKLLGTHNIQNLVGCIAVAHTLGVPLEKMAYPIRRMEPVEHRLQLLPNGMIDDAYNSNPAGFRSALDVLARFDAQRVLVTPGMVELGERQFDLNRECGRYAAARCDYAILVGERQAPPLRQGLLDEGFPKDRVFVAKNLQEALRLLNELPPAPRRIVLLENDLPDNF